MTRRSQQIVIIGSGASGVAVCAQVLRKSGDQDIRISWIGNQTPFALGLAYGTRDPDHLLNVRLQGMSVFPDNPLHLVKWMKKIHPDWDIEKHPFIPRMYFGEYLHSLIDSKDPRVKCIPDEVIRIEERAGRYLVTTENNGIFPADDVVLAMGNLKTERRTGTLTPIELLLIPKENLRDKKILLIGTGLTMFDTVVSLRKVGMINPVTAVSRRGLVPRSHENYLPLPASSAQASSQFFEQIETSLVVKQSLASALRVFRDECWLAKKTGSDWRAVFDLIRPRTQYFWREMSPKLRSRFARHLRPYWDVHRHRVAPEIYQIIQEMLKTGGLKIEKRRFNQELARQFDIQVDCAGFAGDIKHVQSPLVQSLIENQLVELDDPSFSFHAHPRHPHIHIIGPLLKGSLWESVAIPEIRAQAESLAQKIIDISSDRS